MSWYDYIEKLNSIEDDQMVFIKIVFDENSDIDEIGYDGYMADDFIEAVQWENYEALRFNAKQYALDHKDDLSKILDFSYELQVKAFEMRTMREYDESYL